jgi:hypothetical protein
MTIKFGRKYLLLIVLCAFLWNQQANVLSQKIAIENSYQQKVSSAVSRMLGQEKFLVIVSIEFSSVGGTLKKSVTPQSGTSPSVGYIPGLPTLPSNQGSRSSNNIGNQNRSGNDLDIGRVEVTIGMDATSIAGSSSIKQEIKSLVEKIIPQTKDCGDCIKIEAMQFQTDKKNAKLDELEKQIETLVAAKRRADFVTDSIRLVDLEIQLTEVRERRDGLEAIENNRELQRIKEDSIRFVQMIAAEKLQKSQDSLKFINTEKRLERVMESKIKSDSVIIHETLSIVKQQAGGGKEDESVMGMQLGSGGSGIMGSVIFILLIIALMVVTFLAAGNKKPKTIYLKPKGPEKEKGKKKELKNNSDEKEPEVEKEESEEAPAPRPDEDVMRSEIRSLRQTAVSLTVGEKEGASALIKEWLEDNPNKSDEGEEEAGEE